MTVETEKFFVILEVEVTGTISHERGGVGNAALWAGICTTENFWVSQYMKGVELIATVPVEKGGVDE